MRATWRTAAAAAVGGDAKVGQRRVCLHRHDGHGGKPAQRSHQRLDTRHAGRGRHVARVVRAVRQRVGDVPQRAAAALDDVADIRVRGHGFDDDVQTASGGDEHAGAAVVVGRDVDEHGDARGGDGGDCQVAVRDVQHVPHAALGHDEHAHLVVHRQRLQDAQAWREGQDKQVPTGTAAGGAIDKCRHESERETEKTRERGN